MLINYFILLATLCLFCGLALDAGILQLRKLQMQHAADAAALGAMYEAARGSSGWLAAGKADAALNGFTDGVNGVTINIVNPPTSGTYAGKTDSFQVTINQTMRANFMGLVSGGATSIGSSAVAQKPSPDYCVYVMKASPAWLNYTFSQASSGFYTSCDIFINSSTWSIHNDGFSTLKATSAGIDVVGSSSNAVNLGSLSPTPTYGVASKTDPLASVTAPTYSSCDHTNYSVPIFATVTLSPGTYCGSTFLLFHTPGLTLNWLSNVTLQPGLYIITGGASFASASSVSGSGVTLYFTKDSSGYYGQFKIQSTTTTLSAPTSTASGGKTGIVVFADRNWVQTQSQDFQLLSSYITTDGIWYIPNAGIYNYSSTLTAPNYLGLVTDNISSFFGTFTFPAGDYSSLSGGSPFGGSSGGIVQ